MNALYGRVREYGSLDTVSSMKTTIEIPDDLAAEAKRVAREGGSTMRDLVLAGLRSELERRSARVHIDFTYPTQTGRGLVAGLSPSEAISRSYEDPA